MCIRDSVDAAKIQVDQQIPAEEVDSVYNQEVDSNALAGWPVGPKDVYKRQIQNGRKCFRGINSFCSTCYQNGAGE